MSTCKMINVVPSAESCEENFSGVGTEVLAFFPNELEGRPTVSEIEEKYESASFKFKTGKGAYRIKTKTKVNKVTSTNVPDAGGFVNVLMFVVNKQMGMMSRAMRSMNNMPMGYLVADGSGSYYILYHPDFDNSFASSSDTGDAPESERGHTITITSGPMKYSLMKLDGPITMAPEEVTPPVTPPEET